MIGYNLLIALLREMSTGKLLHNDCQDCKHEDNCDIYGCTILRDAIATMEQLYKDVSGLCDTCINTELSMTQEPCTSCNCCDPFARASGTYSWQWRGVQEAQDNG